MEQMKFKVASRDQSVRLQKVLFNLGYEWFQRGKFCSYTDKLYIYVDNKGMLLYSDKNSHNFFESWKGQEYNTEEFIAKHSQPEKTERQIPFGEFVERLQKEPSREKSDGGKTGYYDLVIKTKEGDFRCVVGDVIRAMVGNDFDLGNAIKAIRRIYADSQGFGKEGIDMQYDANKINYFVKEFVNFHSR